MRQKTDSKSKGFKRKAVKKEDSFEGSEGSNVIELLKCIQRQMTFLERKVDNLTNMLENKPGRETRQSKFPGEGKRPYSGSKERKFSRGYSKPEEGRSGGRYKDKESSFVKPFGKLGGFKKKGSSDKKSEGKYQGRKERS